MLFNKKYFNNNLLFCYSTNLLISNYSHIGFKKNLTVHFFRKALLCFYSNVAIINPFLTLANLKFSLSFLFKMLIKNLRTCFVLFDFPELFKKHFSFKNQFYFFNNWISGFLTNYKFNKKYGIIRRNRFCPRLPSSIVVFGAEPQKACDVASEANKLLMPAFIFADSLSNPSNYSYWIPMNQKSGYTKLFFANFVNSMLKKSFIFRRFFFLKTFYNFFQKNKKFKAQHKLRVFIKKKRIDLLIQRIILIRKQLDFLQDRSTILNIKKIFINFKKKHPKLLWRIRIKINKIIKIINRKIIKLN